MAATSICQKFNLKLIALLCCCHHGCCCLTLFIAVGQHLQHIFQMPSSYFAYAEGIRRQGGGERMKAYRTIRTLCVGSNTFRVREYFGWIAVQVDSDTRPEIMFASPNYSSCEYMLWQVPEMKGQGKRRAGRVGNTAHAIVNSHCQYVKLHGVVNWDGGGGEKEDSE